MRKHFLILMLLSLLPLAGWAADGDITEPTPRDITYTGAAQELIDAGAVEGVGYELRYAVTTSPSVAPAWSEFSATLPTRTNAGVYYVYFAWYNTSNEQHSTIEKKVSVELKKAELASGVNYDYKAPVKVTSLAYTGEAQTLIEAGVYGNTGSEAKCGTFTYSLTENGTYTAELPKGTNAGTYTVYWKLSGSDNYKAASGSVADAVIAAQALPDYAANKYTFTVPEGATYVYNGNDMTNLPTIKVQLNPEDDATILTSEDYEVKWYKDEDYTEAETPKYASVDRYYARVEGKGNYSGNINATTKTDWSIVVGKKSVMVYVESMERTYDGEENEEEVISAVHYIKDAKIIATGLVSADVATIKATLKAQYTNDAYNGGDTPSKAGTYEMTAVTTDGGVAIGANYAPDYESFRGSYTINKRSVTVTANTQTFTYTGATQNIITTKDNTYRTIEARDDEKGTGLIDGEENDVDELYNIVLKDGVVIKEMSNDAYTGAITIVPNEVDGNYTIVPVAGNVVVNGKTLKVIASNVNAQYGAKVSDIEFGYLANPNVTLNEGIQYTLTDSEGNDVTESTDVLPIGTYTIDIVHNPALAPTNYTLADEDYFAGELTIAPKDLTITIEDLVLNAGATKATLNQYASTEEYTTVNDEEITFEFVFNTKKADNTTDNGIAVDASGNLNGVAAQNDPYEAAIGANLNPDGITAEQTAINEHYNITFVRGDLVVLEADALILNPADAVLASKISDVDGEEKDIAFGDKKMKKQEWYAMVLPFDVTPAELVQAFGEYVVVNRLSDASSLNNIKFQLEMSEIPAGTPFIIKAASEVNWEDAVFADKEISKDINPTETAGATFTGTYTAATIQHDSEEADLYEWLCDTDYGKKDASGNLVNTWLKPKSNPHTVQPMEAYLILAEGSSYARQITVEDFDGISTSIKSLSVDDIHGLKVAEGWYTLGGVKLPGAPTEKGVYINNGKKVVIK